ncbi:hypothetical protein MTO96_006945 [Rhipicephalus appendiculatus]
MGGARRKFQSRGVAVRPSGDDASRGAVALFGRVKRTQIRTAGRLESKWNAASRLVRHARLDQNIEREGAPKESGSCFRVSRLI